LSNRRCILNGVHKMNDHHFKDGPDTFTHTHIRRMNTPWLHPLFSDGGGVIKL
jgi:hypothetical protein